MDMVQAARDRIAVLEAEIETLKQFVALSARAQSILASSPIQGSGAKPDLVITGGSAPLFVEVKAHENPKPAVVLQATKEILKAHGRPMKRREIYDALVEKGLVIKGAEPLKVLGMTLWRFRDQLIQTKDGYSAP